MHGARWGGGGGGGGGFYVHVISLCLPAIFACAPLGTLHKVDCNCKAYTWLRHSSLYNVAGILFTVWYVENPVDPSAYIIVSGNQA